MRVWQGSQAPVIRSFVPGHDDRVAAFAANFAEAVRHAIRTFAR
jgi:hypothetical protein